MYNHLVIMGRLVQTPEVRYTGNDKKVANFAVAVERKYPSRNRNVRDVDFFQCSAWNKVADVLEKYFQKGDMILVAGSLHNNKFTGRDGLPRDSWVLDVSDLSFTGMRRMIDPQGKPPNPDDDFLEHFDDIAPNPAPAPAKKEKRAVSPDDLPELTDFADLDGDADDNKVPF